MHITQEQELNTRIKSGSLNGIWLILGSEEYLKKKYSRLLLEKAVEKSARTFDAVNLLGKSLNIGNLAEDIEIFPCLGNIRSITISDFDADKILKDDWDCFLKLILQIPTTTQLVLISAEEIDSKRSSRWKKLIELVDKQGVCTELSSRTKSDLVKFVHAKLKPYHAEIETDTAHKLIELCGSDMTILEKEADKLGAYAADNTVKSQDIDALVTMSIDTSAFDMVKLLLKGNHSAAFLKLSILLEQNTEPIIIAAAIGSVYCDLYKAAVAIESGMNQNDTAKAFGYYGMEFRMRNAWNEALRLSMSYITSSLQMICDTDIELKSSSVSGELSLVKLMTSLCVISR